MKKLHILTLIAVSAILIQSCKILYTPNMQNVALLTKKNEVNATVSTANFQAAYAVTEHIGVMLNGQYKNPKWSSTWGGDDYKYESRKTLIEAGAGYFTPIGESGVFEVYGGGGAGTLQFDRSYADTNGGPSTLYDKYSVNTMRFFVQPNIGLKWENADLAFSARFVGLKFFNGNDYGYTQNALEELNIYNLEEPLFMFIEPCITMRAGSEYVKFHAQAMFSYLLNNDPLSYIPFVFNVGVTFRFSDWASLRSK